MLDIPFDFEKKELKKIEQKPAEYTLEQAAIMFLDALSNTPYNNKPITDAQIITKELLKFLSNPSTYNPDALLEQKPVECNSVNMTLDEAIEHCDSRSNSTQCGMEHEQLAKWLRELKEYKEQKLSEVGKEDYDLSSILQGYVPDIMYKHGMKEIECGAIVETAYHFYALGVQSKQEWSEEDCNQIETIACHLDNIGNGAMAESLLNIMDRYKSLRPQNTWKPSEEMLEALYRVIPNNVMEKSEDEMLLDKLYQGLKYGKVLSEN